MTWKSRQVSRNVFEIDVPLCRKSGWEFWTLLTSDRHWDNPKSDLALQIEHLNEAKKRGAAVIDCGDLFCMMQGKYDKRASKESVRPEHQKDNYLDAVIETAAKFFAPYARNMVVLGVGNHESAITKRLETNPTERLCALLNTVSGGTTYNGGFSGWVKFNFRAGPTTKLTSTLHYDHGYAGGGQVTQDAIQHQRRSTYLPDADIVISGHTHDSWVRENARVRLSPHNKIYHDIQTHIKLPTYKEEYSDGYGGWHVETGKPPKPIGACWLRFYWSRKDERVLYEATPAR